jgi:serine protease Do
MQMGANMSSGAEFATLLKPFRPLGSRGCWRSRAFMAAMIVAGGIGLGPYARATAPNGCDVSDVVAQVLPAIVNIQNVGLAHPEIINIQNATAWQARASGDSSLEYSVGTGVIIDPDGLIVTNQHVIQDAIAVQITFQDKTQVPAHLVGAAALQDIALLKVDVPRKLPTLSFGDSDALRVGQPVIAVGNPINVGTSVSTGSVSAVNRNLMRTPFDDYIQTDAAINPGNSGGPLIDCSGKVIGINTALLSNNSTQGSIGLGFALPANNVKYAAAALQDPKIVPNWIGVQLQDMNTKLAKSFKQPTMSGAIVSGVDPGSPAAQASLVPGDIITSVGGKDEPDARAAHRAILTAEPGQPLTLSVWHRGTVKQVTVTGAPWPNFKKLQSQVVPDQAQVAHAFLYGLGLHVIAISDADRLRFGLGNVQGVLIDRVDSGTQAGDLGLGVGDVIQQIGDEICTSPEQATTRLAYGRPDDDNTVAILVHKQSGPQWVSLWVGRPDSRQFVIGAPSVAAGSTVRDASSPLPVSTGTVRQ